MRTRTAAADLLAGVACVGCGRPGLVWCATCLLDLPDRPEEFGLADGSPVFAVDRYAGAVRAAVLAHKERQVFALAGPLGGLLAGAVLCSVAAGDGGAGVPIALVPVPSRRSTVRARGYDAMRGIAEHAAAALRRLGRPAVCAPALVMRRGVSDQSGLNRADRARNLSHAMRVEHRVIPAVGAHLVVCDDVHTTGATIAEARRALASVGRPAVGVAVLARAETGRRDRIDGSLPS